jgi:predicted Rossmann-fold nucleotide-binding protein
MAPQLEADPDAVVAAAQLAGNSLANRVIQNVTFEARHCGALFEFDVEGAVFLGCHFSSPHVAADLLDREALVIPRIGGKRCPYLATRHELYTVEELLHPFDPEVQGSFKHSLDAKIYDHFDAGRSEGRFTLQDSLSQRIHDHAIDDALEALLFDEDDKGRDARAEGRPEDCIAKKVVGVMGGHALKRGSSLYASVAELGYRLCKAGYFVATGGGPGAMEAANLGAWMAARKLNELEEAVQMLGQAPAYSSASTKTTHAYLSAGEAVRQRFASRSKREALKRRSLAIPTWFYGHEPTNQFATEVAKYFSNSIREDGLLAIAQHGVIFAPGKAGTTQEIFQDTCQNHYGTTRMHFAPGRRPEKTVSPMVFLGDETRWREDFPVLPLLEALGGKGTKKSKQYLELTTVLTKPADIVRWLKAHPPVVLTH